MPAEDLGYGAAELLSLSVGEARSLSRLAELAVRQIPGCAAAHAAIWRDGELANFAATHPDSAVLSDLQLRTGRGPLFDAVRRGAAVTCADTLTEDRWPEWAAAALSRGIRCAVDLVGQAGPVMLVLAMFGLRPGVLDADAVPMGEMLAELGGTVLAGGRAYDDTQRTATQLQDSIAARAVTDQAKGILMQSLGCDADEALATMRKESQRHHVKVTQVAQMIIDGRGGKPRA
ncbi:MAG: GAF and ANTAR domain-containing protein [Streptosporangiales bacterium]|nr:GAF and ANTAR domain-containing protein [Streptosporangiales bacterium]